ncbi:hypothetical protein, partial [Diaphorobacter sp.]|uniref:hypothetical protein n=1 Tax=Diaphorobacter sp. TaxID=1934310 RepID=UPI0028A04FC1
RFLTPDQLKAENFSTPLRYKRQFTFVMTVHCSVEEVYVGFSLKKHSMTLFCRGRSNQPSQEGAS